MGMGKGMMMEFPDASDTFTNLFKILMSDTGAALNRKDFMEATALLVLLRDAGDEDSFKKIMYTLRDTSAEEIISFLLEKQEKIIRYLKLNTTTETMDEIRSVL
jgi:glucuronate isomerase